MGQMNVSQARVIDPVLTNVARGYKNQEYVGMKLFPLISVGQRGGQIIEFGKQQLQLRDTRRAPGGRVASFDVGYSGRKYALENHDISGKVPKELLEEAGAVPGVNLSGVAVNTGMESIGLRLEYQQAQLARNTANYASGNTITLSGSGQWSDTTSAPMAALETGRQVIRSKTGKTPNVLLLSALSFAGLKVHPAVLERIKYTSKDSITPQMLAGLLDIDEVVVGGAIYWDDATGAFVDVWGKDAVLAYAAPESLAAMGNPSFAYTYRLMNYPIAEPGYYSNKDKSWHYPVSDEVSPEIVGPDAGYLLKNTVA